MYKLIRTPVYKTDLPGQGFYDRVPQRLYQYNSKKLKKRWDKKHLVSKYHKAIFQNEKQEVLEKKTLWHWIKSSQIQKKRGKNCRQQGQQKMRSVALYQNRLMLLSPHIILTQQLTANPGTRSFALAFPAKLSLKANRTFLNQMYCSH